MPAQVAATAASSCTESASNFAGCLSKVIINPILALLFALALMIFIYGIVQFMWGLTSEAGKKEEGRKHMLWGIVGMFIMVAAYAILQILASSLSVTLPH